MDANTLARLSAANSDALVQAYLKVRQQRDEVRRQEKELNAKLEMLAMIIIDKLQNLKQDAFRSIGYTVYKYERKTASVNDRDLLLEFVRQNNAWQFIDVKANAESANDYLAEHNHAPPGVTVNTLVKLGVRKSTT